MKRVVVTGIGVVSCLGNNQDEVYQSLLNSKSGITFSEEYKEYNLKSNVHGKPKINLEDHVDRKFIRFMGPGSAYNYISMAEAVKDSGLEDKDVSNISTGMIMGSGGPSIENVILAADKTRDGFVIAGGAGVLVLEEYEHAKARGAKIYAELTGYGATSDGYDMVAPSGEGAVRCMQMAMATARNKIDYINTHGTSTPVGDITELNAVQKTFGEKIPKISSTKSLSGHPVGAASVHEAIYCLIMMKNNFIAGSANINEMDEEAKKFPIVTKTEKGAKLNTVMSNSFGFGGTNAALIFEKL